MVNPPLVIALTSEYAPKAKKSMLVGLMSTGFSVGGITVALLGISIIPTIGWKWMFLIGGLPLLALPFMIKFLPESLAFTLLRGGEDQKVRSILSKIDSSYVPKEDDVFEVHLPKTGMPVAKLF